MDVAAGWKNKKRRWWPPDKRRRGEMRASVSVVGSGASVVGQKRMSRERAAALSCCFYPCRLFD